MSRGEKKQKGILRFNRIAKILTALLVALSITVPSVTGAFAAKKANLEMNVSYGFNSTITLGSHVPFTIEVTNKGGDFSGSVQIIIESSSNNVMYEKDFTISAGATKKLTITVPFDYRTNAANVRIVDTREKEVISTRVKLNISSTLDTMHIGVLSDDFTALSYLSDIQLYTSSNYYFNGYYSTQIHELNEDNFPDSSNALDMFDAIVITNFSTDRLSEVQLSALNNWVYYGGRLILGTGSTAAKVYSGLKSLDLAQRLNLNSRTTYKTYSTLYGLTLASPSDYYPSEIERGFDDWYGDWRINNWLSIPSEIREQTTNMISECVYRYHTAQPFLNEREIYKEFFAENEEYLCSVFQKVFLSDFYTDEEWEDFAREKFYNALYDEMLEPVFETAMAGNSGETGGVTEIDPLKDYKPVEAEIADVAAILPYPAYKYRGEDLEKGGEFLLAASTGYGSGSIVVVGVDFTQNPLVSFEGRAKFFTSLINSFFRTQLYMKIREYYDLANQYYYPGYYSYDDESVFEALNSASAPPALLYIILLIAYLALIFISFNVLKKKRKNILFWVTQIGLALIFSLLIFVLGIFTRLHKPEIRSVNIIDISEATYQKNTELVSIVTPAKKKYNISLSDLHSLNRRTRSQSYFAYSGASDLSDYYIGYNQKNGYTDITLKTTQPLNTEQMIGNSISSDITGRFDLKLDYSGSALRGTITNNTGHDLEKAFVYSYNYIFVIGNIKNGQTVEIDDYTVQYSASRAGYYPSFTSGRSQVDAYLSRGNEYGFLDMLFGTNNTSYRNTVLRRCLLDYAVDSLFTNQYTYVCGFTSDVTTSELQTGDKKLAESSYSLIYQRIGTN